MEPAPTNRKASDNRRRSRQRQGIWDLLASLPAPFGASAATNYSALGSWHAKPGGSGIDWTGMPPTCEPCALLNNAANQGKKHGKTVLEQLELLQFSPAPAASADQAQRGMHKRWQVESFEIVLRRLVEANPQRPWHVVDFGCGSGALLLPLAYLFPSCRFTGVDMKPAALAILRQRAAAAGLTNAHTFLGQIEMFNEPFDIALALHACGNATDLTLLSAQHQRAAYIVSPCCVGKLKFSMSGGTSFGATNVAWKWLPRLRGTEEEVRQAGLSLLAAAGAGEGPNAIADTTTGQLQSGPPGTLTGTSGCGPAALGRAEAYQGPASLAGHHASPTGERPAQVGDQAMVLEEQGAPRTWELTHPRSQALTQLLPDPQQQFKLMAKVADTNSNMQDRRAPSSADADSRSHADNLVEAWTQLAVEEPEGQAMQSSSSPQLDGGKGGIAADKAREAAYCALAKLHVELDRNEQAREVGYAVAIMRLLHAQSMAKGDMLVGVPAEAPCWRGLMPLLNQPA